MVNINRGLYFIAPHKKGEQNNENNSKNDSEQH